MRIVLNRKRAAKPGLVAAVLLSGVLSGAQAQTPDESSYYTEPYQEKALEIYRQIVGWRTAKGHGQVPEMAAYLADQFRDGGFADDDINLISVILDSGEETAALVVRYRGDGSAGKKAILLNAHMDVVDALPEDWVKNPFELIEEDEKRSNLSIYRIAAC